MTTAAPVQEVNLRDVFDLAAVNDLTSLLTVICNINPFDCSPGLKCLLERIKEGDTNTNPYIVVLKELNVHASTMSTSRDAAGNTPLHIAAGFGHTLMLEALLLDRACEVNARNFLGFTPLHLASRQGHFECVKLLCGHGANVQLLTSLTEGDWFFRGRSAQFLAHWHGHSRVLRYLQRWLPLNSSSTHQGLEDTGGNAVAADEAHRVWVAAAQQENVDRMAELFEALDCVDCASGPMQDFTNNADSRVVVSPGLTLETVRDIILAVIPLDSDMSEAQQFIFEGFLVRGYISTDLPERGSEDESSLNFSHLVLKKIISGGHVGALRIMCQHGLRQRCLYLLASDIVNASEEPIPSNFINMKCILAETVARMKYEQALKHYREKCQSSPRKEKALSTKRMLRKAQKELAHINIEPLVFLI